MNTDVHTLSGAYAIDALSPEEAKRFSSHLQACPACRQEVRELQAAAARLGASEAATPPAHLKARVISAAAEHPQLPPRVRHRGTEMRRRRQKWLPRLMVAAAAAVLIVAGAIGYDQLQAPEDHDDQLATGVVRVFEAPDAHHATTPTSIGGTVSVATAPSLNKMALDTDRLPDLEDDKVYQLWTIADGTAASAGLLIPDRGAAMELPGEGTMVALTVEPAGGSEQPTSEPIMTVTPSEL